MILFKIPNIEYVARNGIIFQVDKNNRSNRFTGFETLLLAGAGLSAFGALKEGQVANAQGKAQEKIANYNAELADREAKARMDSAKIESDRVARQEKFASGEARATFAKSGISFNEGTPLEALSDMAYQFYMDKNLTLRQGLLGQQRSFAEAEISRVMGKQAAYMGKQAKQLSYFKAAGTVAMAAGSAGMMSKAPTQGLTSNQLSASKAGFGPVSPNYASAMYTPKAGMSSVGPYSSSTNLFKLY